ncbi:MAG: hypothetical protein KC636_32490 [Myxococcales bacterium]|nr:hypothetical protein [Myxococcales bacterium]
MRATEAADEGRDEEALALFADVLAAHRDLDVDVLEGEEGEAPVFLTLANVAILQQRLERWAAMVETTRALVTDHPTHGLSWRLHACAVKHTSDLPAGLEVIDRAIALEPTAANSYHERACILAQLGRVDEAIDACEAALARGSTPEELVGDDELAPLFEQPAFLQLVAPEREARRLLERLRAIDAEINAIAARSDHSDARWLAQEDVIGHMDEALPLVERLLAAVDMSTAPRREHREHRRVDLAACTPLQREAVHALVGCPRLWHAIPFLLLLGEHDLPSTSAHDARLELHMFDELEPWRDPLRRALADPEADLEALRPICDALVEHHPGDAEVWMNRGLLRLWTDERAAALDDFERALERAPQLTAAHANRILALVALARLDEAAAALQRGLAQAPGLREWAANEEAIAALRARPEIAALLS